MLFAGSALKLFCFLIAAILLVNSCFAQSAGKAAIDTRFKKHIITSEFISEGAAVAALTRSTSRKQQRLQPAAIFLLENCAAQC